MGRQWYVFTFGIGVPNGGRFVRVYGTYEEARNQMFETYGRAWAFQYAEGQWKQVLRDSKERGYPVETEMAFGESSHDV